MPFSEIIFNHCHLLVVFKSRRFVSSFASEKGLVSVLSNALNESLVSVVSNALNESLVSVLSNALNESLVSVLSNALYGGVLVRLILKRAHIYDVSPFCVFRK
jgi:hypothetical protein